MMLKKIISYVLFAIFLPIVCLPLYAFNAYGEVNIQHDEKGSAVFFVESTLDEDAFEEKIEMVIDGFNTASGSNDMVVLKGIENTGAVYKVKVSFRRIDKVHPRGDFNLYKAGSLKLKQSEELDSLQRWERGDINCKSYVFYNRLRGLVQIKKPRAPENGPKVVIKPNTASGEQLSVKQFAERVSADNQILSFQLLDMMGVQKVQVSLPGAITYYGGGVKVVGEGTFEITPITVQAEVTRNNEETLESIVTTENIQIFIGYVAYKKSISPFEIAMIATACTILVGAVVGILGYFHQRGKKVQQQEENWGN